MRQDTEKLLTLRLFLNIPFLTGNCRYFLKEDSRHIQWLFKVQEEGKEVFFIF